MDKLIRIEQDTALLNPEASKKLAEFERQVKAIEEQAKELKNRILEEMEAKGIISIETDDLTITYVAPYPKEFFDSKAFRKANPDLYDEYVKISKVSASVRLKVK
jgi:predicted phage-related endonuclease